MSVGEESRSEEIATITQRVITLVDRCLALESMTGEAERLSVVREKLEEPLRVAVAGRLKAGKSTLVNALLRQRVASVAVGECTKVVTWFKYGHQETVEVVPRGGGESWSLSLTPEGRLPEQLGADPATIERVVVRLSNDALRTISIIDTPGLDSLDAESSAATEDLLAIGEDSRDAIAQADALLFLLPHLSKRDQDRLSSFHSLFVGTGLSAVSTIGVLSKADKLGDPGENPLRAARTIADRYAEDLGAVVASVVPVVGLLAETSDADAFTEGDAHDLRTLAELGPEAREEFLLSADWFLDDESLPISVGRREHLLEILDLYGLARSLELISGGYERTPALVERLGRASGIADLRDALSTQFGRRSEALKAHAALSDLERLSYIGDEGADATELLALRSDIERLRLAPEMHQLRELEAARLWASGEIRLTPEFGAELERIACEVEPRPKLGLAPDATPDECAARAIDRAGAWLTVQNDPRSDRATARAAATIQESFVILWESFGQSDS